MKRQKVLLYLGYGAGFLTLLSLMFLSQVTKDNLKFENFYKPLLITIGIGISFLTIIVVVYLKRLAIHYINKSPGASLSLTILWRSLFLAFIPLFFTSFFAFKFLRYEFQSSFDEGINDALNNALVLSNQSTTIRANQALADSHNIANEISHYGYNKLQRELDYIRDNIGAYELTVLDEKGFIQSFASQNMKAVIPKVPKHTDFIRVENEGGIFTLESNNNRFSIRTLVSINKPNSPNYYLQSVFYLANTVSDLKNQINQTITERDKLRYLLPQVNNSFILVLVLVVLLSVLFLILSSVSFANDMSQPIRSLIEGTKRLSRGDFKKPLIIKRHDDFGTLMLSFNRMTESIRQATDEAKHHQQRVENEHAYLATVINVMTSGVITLDYQYRLQTYNKHAELILQQPLEQLCHQYLSLRDTTKDHYTNFISKVMKEYKKISKSNELEISIEINNDFLDMIVNVTPLPSTDDLHGGYVVIFEVMGEYLQKQKQAAWEEVARRLAHEIKNPLTPIQLSAERLNYKLSGHLEQQEQQILSRATEVIIKQVTALKEMVNDFSDYAKPPKQNNKSPINFISLLKDVCELYFGHYNNIHFILDDTDTPVIIYGDPQLLRQTLHNLIKNSIESIEACAKEEKTDYQGRIAITLATNDNQVQLSIIDNGLGLTLKDKKVFEPYVTTKEKGTGLGLAIVKKIIHDHNGEIYLLPRHDHQGAIASITLPIAKDLPHEQYIPTT